MACSAPTWSGLGYSASPSPALPCALQGVRPGLPAPASRPLILGLRAHFRGSFPLNRKAQESGSEGLPFPPSGLSLPHTPCLVIHNTVEGQEHPETSWNLRLWNWQKCHPLYPMGQPSMAATISKRC